MNKLDEYALDGRLLKMLVTVHETGSVTAAALAMNVTQSTVSHGLNRLRAITGDDLFVPMGRSITPTEKADTLAAEARAILERLAQFSRVDEYVPSSDTSIFTIAATDYEVELIVRPFIRKLRQEAPGVQVQVLRARPDSEWVELLRTGEVDLVLAPELETAEMDVKQRRVLTDDADLIYFDATQRQPPDSLDAYCAADHVVMAPGRLHPTAIDRALAKLGRNRRVAASLPSFAAVASVLRGTDMIALMPERLQDSIFGRLSACKPPFVSSKVIISAIWHIRADGSKRHKWMRQLIVKN